MRTALGVLSLLAMLSPTPALADSVTLHVGPCYTVTLETTEVGPGVFDVVGREHLCGPDFLHQVPLGVTGQAVRAADGSVVFRLVYGVIEWVVLIAPDGTGAWGTLQGQATLSPGP